MGGLSTESTPRERLARLLTLLSRTRMFWRSALAIAALGLVVSFGMAEQSKRIWRSETTVLYRDGMKASALDAESATQRAQRLGPKLKDLLYARPNLEQVIREYNLFRLPPRPTSTERRSRFVRRRERGAGGVRSSARTWSTRTNVSQACAQA